MFMFAKPTPGRYTGQFCPAAIRSAPQPALPQQTGPLPQIGSALLIGDVENLTLSARDLGCALHYDRLLAVVAPAFDRLEAHAYFSREAGDESWVENLGRFGWRTHPRDIVWAKTVRGVERFSNSDNALAFGAGMLATDTRFDTVLLGTGDGALGCDLAAAIRAVRGQSVRIHTLSIAGSTSRRLLTTENRYVDGNVAIGADCLSRIGPRPAHPGRRAE